MNEYRYTGNHPTMATDPSGLEYVDVDSDGNVWAYPESWWFGFDYDDSRVYAGKLAAYETTGGQTRYVIDSGLVKPDLNGDPQPVLFHFDHFANYVDSYEFTNIRREHLLDYAARDGFIVNDPNKNWAKWSPDDPVHQFTKWYSAYHFFNAGNEFVDYAAQEVAMTVVTAGAGSLLSNVRYLKKADDAIESVPHFSSSSSGVSKLDDAMGAGIVDDALTARMRSQNLGRQLRHTAPMRGLGGRILSSAERAEFNAFGDRANALGLIESLNRTGSWGRIVNGRYQEIARIDVAEIGMPGWRGQTHMHLAGQRGHLPLTTQIPGK